jgi:hypothetical protein
MIIRGIEIEDPENIDEKTKKTLDTIAAERDEADALWQTFRRMRAEMEKENRRGCQFVNLVYTKRKEKKKEEEDKKKAEEMIAKA